MKRIILLSIPLALLAACTPAKKGCKATGCGAGSVCNTVTDVCEVQGIVGGGGGDLGGGSGGGSGGGTGGGMGGGGGGMMMVDAGVDAGMMVVDPFDDGGVFVPGDICNYALPVDFDGGVTATASVDLAAATNQYVAVCNSSTGDGNDVIFAITLTQPQGLIVTATDTSGKDQNAVLSLLNSPCASLQQSSCIDDTTAPDDEILTVDNLAAGTWYVLLENNADDNTGDGTYDVQFELTAPVPAPPNDSCATAQALTFTGGAATATGTTVGAFNDTGGQPLTCSADSALSPDVFYTFTLTQPQDVTVTTTVPSTSDLTPAVAITTACGVGGPAVQRGCSTNSTFTARSLPAGTYFIVVDGDGGNTGAFSIDVGIFPPTPVPMNDTCTTPTTLVPGTPVSVDANTGTLDYQPTCSGSSGGDVVYQFTTTMTQRVTVTATGMNQADAVISLRGAPCDDEQAELDCMDNEISGPEVITVNTLPAGTYYVILSAYTASAGQFTLQVDLSPPPQPPANESCATATPLVPNMSQMIDLTVAASDETFGCYQPFGGDAVYSFTTTQAQRVVITATSIGSSDAVLALRGDPCATSTELRCVNNSFSAPEVLTYNNLPAGTYYVLIGSDGFDAQFGVELSLTAPIPPPTNETCSAPQMVTLTGGSAALQVDLSDAMVDMTLDCATAANGTDLVYEVTIPAMQTLTVDATPAGFDLDLVLAAYGPVCTMSTSLQCADNGVEGDSEEIVVPNTTASPITVFVVVKAYDLSHLGELELLFDVQ